MSPFFIFHFSSIQFLANEFLFGYLQARCRGTATNAIFIFTSAVCSLSGRYVKDAIGKMLTMFSRTMKQSNWTESRRVWTKSTPTCARPRKISLEWKSAAVSAFSHATSRAVPNRFTLLILSNLLFYFTAHSLIEKFYPRSLTLRFYLYFVKKLKIKFTLCI